MKKQNSKDSAPNYLDMIKNPEKYSKTNKDLDSSGSSRKSDNSDRSSGSNKPNYRGSKNKNEHRDFMLNYVKPDNKFSGKSITPNPQKTKPQANDILKNYSRPGFQSEP